MFKLGPSLQLELAWWRTQLGYARSGKHAELSLAELEARRVTVVVTHRGDVPALREAGLETGFDSGGKISGLIALRNVERLEASPAVLSVVMEPRVRLGLDGTVKELRVPWKIPPTDPWPGKGAGVIVAVVDTGIDIFHESFRNADNTTRILELWDQSATAGGSAPPTGFAALGRVYSRENIRDALAAGPPFASIDNDGHGTHIAGIAAGNGKQDDRCSFPGRYVGVAPEADLVIVKAIGIPNFSIRDALRWCAQAGSRHPEPTGAKPVVINLSFGFDTGPHDGTGEMDGFIDEFLRPAAGPPEGLAVVVLAGNSGNKEIHEGGTIPGGGTVTIPFHVPDRSLGHDTLEIWYNGTATLDVELIAPPGPAAPGNTTGTITPGAPGSPYPIGTMRLHVVSAPAPMPANNNKKQIRIAFVPAPGSAVRSGPWQLRLTETAGVEANWDAWFQTAPADAFPTFRMPNEVAPVERRRQNTIWEPGTSRNAITVASYDDDGKREKSSSLGPPNQAAPLPVGEFKPTVAAPGVGVAAPRGRDHPKINSSCCDQKVIDETGTSMAAPHVTGLVALMFEKNRTLTFEQVRAHLQHSTRIDGIPSAEVPPVFDAAMNIRANALWGSGKVNAAVALAEMPAMQGGGGGGGGGGSMTFDTSDLGYTPHTLVSRLGDWRHRLGPRPGLMLFAALVSEHVDEILRLINHNRRVAAVWRRRGGPLLMRRLLHGPPPQETLLPRTVEGCDVAALLAGFIPILFRFGGSRLKADIARFGEFATLWPGGSLARLDAAALELGR